MADCSIVPFDNRTGPKAASFASEIVQGPTQMYSAVLVKLAPRDTVNLWGKFIYQITIKMPASDSAWGKVEIPLYGILYIGRNINAGFISEFTN